MVVEKSSVKIARYIDFHKITYREKPEVQIQKHSDNKHILMLKSRQTFAKRKREKDTDVQNAKTRKDVQPARTLERDGRSFKII